MVRTSTTRIVRAPFSSAGHNLSSSSVGSTINSYVMGSPTTTAFISSPAGGRRNTTAVSTFIPVQSQSSGEESMSLIVQLGTTVVGSSNSQIVSNTMTVAKATSGTVLTSRNYHVNKVSQQTNSSVIHRQTNSAKISPVSSSHLQIQQQQLMAKPSCIVEVQTPKLENVKEELPPADDSNTDDEDIGEEKRPIYSGHVAMSYQFALQDHNYGAPPPVSPPRSPVPPHSKISSSINGISGSGNNSMSSISTSYGYGSGLSNLRSASVKKTEEDEEEEEEEEEDDDANSVISSNPGRDVEPEGEETETAPEGEGDDEDSVTRCICDFEHDDGYMICCDKCFVWQHVDCMGIDRSNIPEEYMCERCQPRRVDKNRARTLQMRKREELLNNDSSSDTSSTSSADTDNSIMTNSILGGRKRHASSSVGRRKNEPINAGKRNTVSTNSSANSSQVVKQRQRRDSTVVHRRSMANQARKREPPSRQVEKRSSVRRKSKSRLSDEEKEDMNPGIAMQQLRQWIDNYEEAVTNHYSPELRARLTSAKVNGTHADLKTSSIQNPGNNTTKCKVSQIAPGIRILVATSGIPANSPVIEIRGKYMLSGQHKPVSFAGVSTKRSRPPPPGPFLFFYRLPKDGTEVCVDARTYGNDARFVRRSCKPNAELKHCIEKGALHLYIVTLSSVEKNEEIMISHYLSQDLLGQNHMRFVCACNNPKECAAIVRRNGVHGSFERERRRRGRRTVSSEEDISNQSNTYSSTVQTDAPVLAITPLRRNSSSNRSPVKAQVTPPILEETCEKNKDPDVSETSSEKSDKKKMTREERKMEAIMKAFERLEKAEQRRQENQAKQAQRKEHDTPRKEISDVKKEVEKEVSQSVTLSKSSLERPRRRRRKGRRLNSTSQQSAPQSKRRTRRNSIDSDATSCDEVTTSRHIRSPSPPCTPVTSSSHSVNSQDMSPGNRLQTAAGLLLALSNTQMPGISQSYDAPRETTPPPLLPPPPPPPVIGTTPHGGVNPNLFSSVCDSGVSGSSGSSSQGSTPPTPLSAACLMVAAAVGPLAPGFKFPKTKKVLMNEWLNKSPDPPSTMASHTLPSLISSVQNRLPEPLESVEGYSYKSLATLVQAATSVGMGSPTSQCQNVSGRLSGASGAGSAKKRWLRQAISEECDSPNNSCLSPNSRAGSPPCPDYVTPLKKRRLARESMSSEQSFTPPPTPTMSGDLSVSNGSPLHKEVSHFEMAANALGVSCDDDDDEDDEVEGSPTDSCTPHVHDDDEEEEYEGLDVKREVLGKSHDHTFEEDPSLGSQLNAQLNSPEELQCEEEEEEEEEEENEEEEEHAGGIIEGRSESETVGCENSEVETNEGGKSDDSQTNFEQSEDGETIVDDKACISVQEILHSSSAPEDSFITTLECRMNDSLENECMKTVGSVQFKTPVEIADEFQTSFKKPANIGSPESEVSSRKDSPNTEESSSSVQPAKRKLSISEYRQRKQRTSSCSEQPSRPEEGENALNTSPARIRNRSDSTSSSSSMSSDDARTNKILADTPTSLTTLPLFLHPDVPDDKKGTGEEVNYVRWNSAPTLVERQRENLTERLRREFGLFLSDDEEQERARKQGLPEALKDGKKKALPPPPPPPPPPLPPPPPSDTSAAASSQHVMNMYPPAQKVHSGSVSSFPMNASSSSSATYTPGYIPGGTATGAVRNAVINGPSYGAMYPVSGPVKGQLYQTYSPNVTGKGMCAVKSGKVPMYPGTANSVNLAAPGKSYYNNSNSLPFPVPGQYPSSSAGAAQPQQVVMVAPPRGVPPPATPAHFISPSLPQTNSSNQQQAPTGPGSFYSPAPAKGYYQTSHP